MKFEINDLDDFNLEGKTVLCRVDMNQPVNRETDTLNSTHRLMCELDAKPPIPPAISHRNTRCVDRAGKYFLEYAA